MEYFRQYGKRITVSIIGVILAVSFVYMICIPAHAAQMGTIADLAAHVYEKADTDSNIVANVILGNYFPILAAETDEGGNVWYLIETDMGVQGYIQAQNVISFTDEAQNANANESGNGMDTQMREPDIEEENENESENNLPESMEKKLLTIEVVNIRENPSTNEEILGKIPRGVTLDFVDTITNTNGEVWYEVWYEDIHGFVKQSTVKEIEVPVQGTDGTQPYPAGSMGEDIDIDQLIETARQYHDESPAGESVTAQEALEESQTQEQIITYDNAAMEENAGENKKIPAALRPDMVIILSFLGILLCAVIIVQTFKKMMKLYR